MESLTLSKKQQKSTLSAKKTKTKTTVKNVLMNPYDKHWPLVNNTDQTTIEEALKSNLPRVAKEKMAIPWKELIKIPKKDRKKFKEQYYIEHNGVEINHNERQGLVLGVNDVTKSLEQNGAKAVLISSDVQPRLFVEHVIDQCILNNVSVLILPELKDILKKTCGVKSAVVSFSKNCNNSKLNSISDVVRSIARKYNVTRSGENTVNSFRSIIEISDSVIEIDDSVQIVDDTVEKMEIDAEDVENTESILQQLHLKRDPNSQKRVFVPNYQVPSQKSFITESFIAFSTSTDDVETLENVKSNQKIKYTPLKVKRLKGNVDRNKKKIKALKRKK